MNLFDRFISYLSPTAGARRARARVVERVISKYSRGYDGGSKGRRTGGWTTGSTSANTEIQGNLVTLRNRARDLVRNDPFAARAVQAYVANIVGPGIIPTPAHRTDSRSKAAADLWRKWAESTQCDFEGRHDFYGLQSMICRALVESGEVLVRRIRTRSASKLAVPLQLQILESDFLDVFRNNVSLPEGGYILQGIEFDSTGKRVAYWLYRHHPGDVAFPLAGLVSDRVPVEEIMHIYRADRPGQVRGVTWLAPILLRLRDFNEFEDAHLVRQKIAACFTAFTIDAEPALDTAENPTSDLTDRVEPGMIMNLPPGKDVKFGNPPGVEGYGEYSRAQLRAMAAGLNMPYEVFSGDLSQVNYSSGRMGWLEFHRNIQQWVYGLIIPQVCDPTWRWFIEAARISEPKADGVVADWTPPRREMINPTEEVKAALTAIRGGIQTRSDFIRSMGNDPDRVYSELKSDNDTADKLGLVLDSDARKVTQVGQIQQLPQPADSSSDDKKGAASA
jgi:lambda family phage portal protein